MPRERAAAAAAHGPPPRCRLEPPRQLRAPRRRPSGQQRLDGVGQRGDRTRVPDAHRRQQARRLGELARGRLRIALRQRQQAEQPRARACPAAPRAARPTPGCPAARAPSAARPRQASTWATGYRSQLDVRVLGVAGRLQPECSRAPAAFEVALHAVHQREVVEAVRAQALVAVRTASSSTAWNSARASEVAGPEPMLGQEGPRPGPQQRPVDAGLQVDRALHQLGPGRPGQGLEVPERGQRAPAGRVADGIGDRDRLAQVGDPAGTSPRNTPRSQPSMSSTRPRSSASSRASSSARCSSASPLCRSSSSSCARRISASARPGPGGKRAMSSSASPSARLTSPAAARCSTSPSVRRREASASSAGVSRRRGP